MQLPLLTSRFPLLAIAIAKSILRSSEPGWDTARRWRDPAWRIGSSIQASFMVFMP
jgi:hypothetical protein